MITRSPDNNIPVSRLTLAPLPFSLSPCDTNSSVTPSLRVNSQTPPSWAMLTTASLPMHPTTAATSPVLSSNLPSKMHFDGLPEIENLGGECDHYSLTLGTWEKCHCNQIVTVTRGSLVTNQSFGTCQKCHCKRGVTVNSVTVSGETVFNSRISLLLIMNMNHIIHYPTSLTSIHS